MKFIITTEIEKNEGTCSGCVFEDTDERCTKFCPGDDKVIIITKFEPLNKVVEDGQANCKCVQNLEEGLIDKSNCEVHGKNTPTT